MSDTLIHILNGDSLSESFPEAIKGERIIFREALIEGPTQHGLLSKFYEDRDEFIKFNYGHVDIPNYFEYAVPELDKFEEIGPEEELNLWFEDDLFCQVNFWYLVTQFNKNELYLIRPTTDIQFGFGGMNKEDLVNAFLQRTYLDDEIKDQLTCLWPAYVDNDIAQLRRVSMGLPEAFEFIRPAIHAHIERQPDGDSPGRPMRRLKEIIQELETRQFSEVFREFSKTDAIYGYGDLQVKRLFEIVIKNMG